MKIKDLAETALCSALIAVCSWIMIPGPVPFTLQTAGVFFTLFTLGGVKGTISVLVYILLGIIGLPVFSGFGSGISVILGPTGGYIVGFLATGICVCIGDIVRKKTGLKKIYTQIISMLAGLIVCYSLGTVWYMSVKGGGGAASVLWACVFPFVIPDILKLLIAYKISSRISKTLKNI